VWTTKRGEPSPGLGLSVPVLDMTCRKTPGHDGILGVDLGHVSYPGFHTSVAFDGEMATATVVIVLRCVAQLVTSIEVVRSPLDISSPLDAVA
jgi:hypothetical protein